MNIIKLNSSCIVCGSIGDDDFKYTCKYCSRLLPSQFYDNTYHKIVPSYIPVEQHEQYLARYIIKYLKG